MATLRTLRPLAHVPTVNTARPAGHVRAVLLAWTLTLSPMLWAIDAGTAHGDLLARGTSLELAHAAALRYTDRADLGRSAGAQAELRIALSPTPLDASLLDGPGRQRLRAQAYLAPQQGVLLVMSPDARGAVSTGEVTLLSELEGQSPRTYALSGLQLAFGEHRVLGAIDYTSADGVIRVLARFSAPLFHDQPPLLDLHGEQARGSPQAAVLVEFEQGLRQGAFERARGLATPALLTRLVDLEQRDEAAIEALVVNLDAPSARLRAVQRLVVVPPYAYLLMAPGGKRPAVLREWQGRWLVDVP